MANQELQDKTVQALLAGVRSAEKKIEIYFNACREIQYERPEDAMVFAESARKLAKKAKLKERELHARRMIGICQYAAHDFEGALKTFRGTLPGYRRLHDPSGESRALQNVGMALRALGHNDEAIHVYRNSEVLIRALADDATLATLLTNIGSTYAVLDRPKDALFAFSECLAIAEKREFAVFSKMKRLAGNISIK